MSKARRVARAFTLLELIIVVAIVGILAAIAMPNLLQTPTRAREAVLKTNLRTLREVLDQHYGDQGFYPESLEVLVEQEYIRNVPYDPMTGSDEWGVVYDQDDTGYDDYELDAGPGILDVYSLSEGTGLDGTPYSEW